MIHLTDINGRAHHVASDNIARITEAGTSSQWHGIRAFVKTHDGVTLEVLESVDQIAEMIERAIRADSIDRLGQINVITGAHVDQRVSVVAPETKEVDAVSVDLGLNGGEHHLQSTGSALPHGVAPLAGGNAIEAKRQIGELQAEIAGHEAANFHLSRMVDELRELAQDAKQAMKALHQAAIPDESQEGVPATIPPSAFHRFVDAHAQLCFCLHQLGHDGPREKPQRYKITSIKYLAGELTLRVEGDGEVPQELESGLVVILQKGKP